MTVVEWSNIAAVLFDLDGVITPTAEVHMRAWNTMFSAYLAAEHPEAAAYTDRDYYHYVDGKPRYEGVASFLASRSIEATETLTHELGDRKNTAFEQVLADEGVTAFSGSVQLIDWLEARGMKLAVVSSSKNATLVLRSAGLIEHFPVIVDGLVATEEGLAGKPAPDTFLDAAAKLSVDPQRAVVIEDAVSGVQAGAAGGFGLVIGVDRGAGAETLRAHGADLVVTDLADLIEGADA